MQGEKNQVPLAVSYVAEEAGATPVAETPVAESTVIFPLRGSQICPDPLAEELVK